MDPTNGILRRVSASSPPAEIVRILNEDGCVVLQHFLSKDQVESINNDLEPLLCDLRPGIDSNDEYQTQFFGEQTKRLNNLPTHSPWFNKAVLDADCFHGICEEIFLQESGSFWLNSAQVIEIGSGNPAQMLHRDMENNRLAMKLGPSGPEVNVNFLIALSPFTDSNGATRVIPKSNHWPDYYHDERHQSMTLAAEMEPGDVLLISGKVVHGGGHNQTQQKRRCIALSVQPAFFTPEEAFPFELGMDTVKTMTPRAQKVVGFRTHWPKGSMGIWLVNAGEAATHLGLDSA
jgi:ectoine hydroxylase-related dioxygenase (phytanoyl-CoA dioxygenase family)